MTSQNHVFFDGTEDCEGLGDEEFKKEKEEANKNNAEYYGGIGVF